MAWDQGLVGSALAIASTDCKYMRVMAGPGTGKTFAMKRRVARLLEQGCDPKRLLIVTFTRVAASGLVKELAELGIAGCEDTNAGTLHSFCFGVLSREEVFEFLGRVPRPLITFAKSKVLQFEAAPLIADIRNEGRRNAAKRVKAFEAAWARLQSDVPGWPQDAVDRQFHGDLIRWLTFHRAILIGELVPEVLKYLRSNPLAPELSAFDHVIVDEYQDLNRADQALLDLVASGSTVIIGDENQSIYRFRYAHPEGINEFNATHDPTHDEGLAECRRCPTRVVTMANSLIMYNHEEALTPQLLPTAGNPEGQVLIVQWPSIEAEASGTAKYVKWLTGDGGYGAGDILILCPRRLIAYKVRDALKEQEVPAHSFYHEEALEEDAAQEAFAYLTLLASPDDRVALRFLLGFGSDNWLKGQYAKLRARCEQIGASPADLLGTLANGKDSLAGTDKLVERYKVVEARLSALQQISGTTGLVDALFPDGVQELRLLRDSVAAMNDEMLPSDVLERLRNLITQPEMPEKVTS